MKNVLFKAHKNEFILLDFYIQCFLFALTLFFIISSILSGYFMFLRIYIFIPIAIYNFISLTYHLYKGSYSKRIGLFRKIHALIVVIYLIAFVLIFLTGSNAANQHEITFLIFWAIPPVFSITYFLITWQDFKTMNQKHSKI
jgi:hypothetical protein